MSYKIVIVNPISGAYIKSVVPYSDTTSLSEALITTIEDLVNYEETENFYNATIDKLITDSGSPNWEIQIYSEDLGSCYSKGISSETALKVEFIDSEKLPGELIVQMQKFYHNLSDCIESMLLKMSFRKAVGLATKTLATSEATETFSTCTKSPEEDEIKELIEKIKTQTKADIVKPKETLDNYVCNSVLKDELVEICNFFENGEAYKKAGIELPKGVLFKGAPGTGKTFAAKCIAGSVDCYFMSCTASSLQGMYIGSGAENIRAVFKGAKSLHEASKKGVIVFIDELDSFGSRESHSGNSGGEEDRTINQLLAEMSGFENTEGIMVLGATNYANRLDDALTRAGRFSRHITIEKPETIEREHLLKYYYDKIKLPMTTDVAEIAELTKGFTPADIQAMSNESGILAIRQGKTQITLDMINEAINKTITKDIRKPDDTIDVQKKVAAHEIGHVVAEICYLQTVPVKVTNYSYGSAGGFTQPGFEPKGMLSAEQVKGYVMCLLGGRAAEIVFDKATTGASEDLDRARSCISNYYKTYLFEFYEVDKLEQHIDDTLHKWLDELVEEFKKPDVKHIMDMLVNELVANRVLYTLQIASTASKILKI